ncbi:MAG: TIGR00725 family protein, partial [Calditrichaeota bacterium]
RIAEEVGRLIAKAGALLVCGGRTGVMEAACKGASEAKGITIGVLPSDDVHQANPYVTIPIATGMGIGRNIIIVRSAAALIAINGRYGTISEISFALQLGKPVFALKPWLNIPGVQLVETASEAVEKAIKSID